jgi:hypothetical protein
MGDTRTTGWRRIFRLLWEIIFPYEIRWGTEEEAARSHGIMHDFSKQKIGASNKSRRPSL